MQQKQYSNGRSVLCDITNNSRLDKKLLKNQNETYKSSVEKIKTQAPTPAASRFQTKYSLIFPPGPMGLELEPVITSSERQIGCRIKDYYFGIDHNGISEVDLKKNVQPGDVIVDINAVSVLSFPFLEILEMLRNLRTESKTITFKNMTASWNHENNLSRSFHDINKENITDIDRKVNRKNILSPGNNFTVWTDTSEDSDRIYHNSIIRNDTTSKTPIKTLFSEGNASSEVETMSSSDSSRKRNIVDNSVKHPYRKVIKYRNQVMQESDPGGNHLSSNHSIQQQQNEFPHSNIKLAQITTESSPTTTAHPISDNLTTSANKSHDDKDNHIAVNEALSIVGSHIGTGVVVAGAMVGHRTVGIVQAAIGSTLGKCASEAATVVGSIVSDRAERTVGDTLSYLPLYSSREMELISNSKEALLKELSQSYIKLGEVEKANTQLQHQNDVLTTNTNNLRTTISEIEIELHQLREANKDLMSRNNQHILDKDQLHLHSQSTESEMKHLREEVRKFSSNNSKLSSDLSQERETVDKLQDEERTLRKQLQTSEDMQMKMQLQFEGCMRSHQEELGAANNKTHQATNQIVSLQRQWEIDRKKCQHDIQSIQEARDNAVCELEVLQDTLSSDKATAAAEVSRLRASLTALQETHRQRLQESEFANHSLKQELVETTKRLTAFQREVEEAAALQSQHSLSLQMKSESLSKQQMERIKALESQLSVKDSESLELRHSEESSLGASLRAIKLQNETKDRELQAATSQVVQLQEMLTTRLLELNNIRSDLVRTENDCQNLHTKLSQKESENISLGRDVDHYKSHIKTLTESLTDFTHNLHLEKDNYSALEQLLLEKETTIRELQQNCENVRINRDDLAAKLQAAQSDLRSSEVRIRCLEDCYGKEELPSCQRSRLATPPATPPTKHTQTTSCPSPLLLNQLYSQISELKLTLKDLQLYVMTLTRNYNETLSFMRNKLMEECSRHVAVSSSDCAILSARLSVLSMEKAVAIERKADIESSLLQMEDKIACLQTQLDEQTQLANINSNKDQSEANKETELKYSQLQSDFSQLQIEYNQLIVMKHQSEESSQSLIQELQSELSECSKSHKEMEVELSAGVMTWRQAASNQRVRYEAERGRVQAELAGLSVQCEELMKKLSLQEKEHLLQMTEATDRIREEEKLTQSLTQSTQQLVNQLDDCTKKLQVSESELQLTVHQLSMTKNDLHQQQRVSQQLHTELSSKDTAIMELKSDLQQTQAETTTHRMKFEELQLKYQELSKEKAASELAAKRLQEQKDQIEAESRTLKSQLDSQGVVIEDRLAVVDSLQDHVSRLEAELADSNHQLLQSQREIEYWSTRSDGDEEKRRAARLAEEDTHHLLTTQLRDAKDRIEGLEMELETREKEIAAVTHAKEKEISAVIHAKEKEIAAVTHAKETLTARFYELISALTAQGSALKEAETRMGEWLAARVRFESMVHTAHQKAAAATYELMNERLQFESRIVKLQQEKVELAGRVAAAEEARSIHLYRISTQESKLIALEQKIVDKTPTVHESTSTDFPPAALAGPRPPATPGTNSTSTSSSTSTPTNNSTYINTVCDPISLPPPTTSPSPRIDMYALLNEIKVYTESAAHLLTDIRVTQNININTNIADNSSLDELAARISGIRKLVIDYQSASFTTHTPPSPATTVATTATASTAIAHKKTSTVSMRKEASPPSIESSGNAQSRNIKSPRLAPVTDARKICQQPEEIRFNSQTEHTSQKRPEKKFDFSYIILHIIIKLQRAIIRKNINNHHQQNNTIATLKHQLQQQLSEGKDGGSRELTATIRCLRELVTEERSRSHIMTTRFLNSLERLREIRILYKSFIGLMRNVSKNDSKKMNNVVMSLDVSPSSGDCTCNRFTENTVSLSSHASTTDAATAMASVNLSSNATSPVFTITPERKGRYVPADIPQFWELSPDSPLIALI